MRDFDAPWLTPTVQPSLDIDSTPLQLNSVNLRTRPGSMEQNPWDMFYPMLPGRIAYVNDAAK
jgi:hypothetical protein